MKWKDMIRWYYTFHLLYTLCFDHEKKQSFYNNRVVIQLVGNHEWKTKWVEIKFYEAAFLFFWLLAFLKLRPFGFLLAFCCTGTWQHNGNIVRIHNFQWIMILCGIQHSQVVPSQVEIFTERQHLNHAVVTWTTGRKQNGLNLRFIY